MGLLEEKEERMEELRTSRSLASRAPLDMPSGEPPLKMWEGIADLGFEPGGGDDLPELIVGNMSTGQEREYPTAAVDLKHGDEAEKDCGKRSHSVGECRMSRLRLAGGRLTALEGSLVSHSRAALCITCISLHNGISTCLYYRRYYIQVYTGILISTIVESIQRMQSRLSGQGMVPPYVAELNPSATPDRLRVVIITGSDRNLASLPADCVRLRKKQTSSAGGSVPVDLLV